MLLGDSGEGLPIAGEETMQPGGGRYVRLSHSVMIATVLLLLYLSSLHSYLFFHSLIEIITISIAFTLFIITWNARRFLTDNSLRLLGIGYAFIALIDLLHTLAYKGMSVFSNHSANLPTQLWIGARYLQALILCAAPFLVRRRFNDRIALAVCIFSMVAMVGLIYSGNFPDCFLEGTGLTPFKIISEYVITALLIVATLLFFRQWWSSRQRMYLVIVASTVCTIASEIFFTAYVSVYGFANLLGHFFKLAAFYLIYRAILATGFREPIKLFFRELKQAYDRLRETNANLEQEIEERIHAEDELRQARDELEARVEARTVELRFANERLQDELVETELAEEALREREEYIRQSRDQLMEQQQTLTSLLRGDLFAGKDMLQAVQHLLQVSAEELEVERVSLWRFSPDYQRMHCIDLYRLSARLHDAESRMELAVTNYPAYFNALQIGELIVADDAQSNPATREFSDTYLTPLGITSMLDAPVQLNGKLEGVLCHEHVGEPVSWGPEQQMFAVAMANLVSLALEQAERRQLEGEREHLQVQLFQAQKMEAIGQLAGGVAHDFNNILTAIIGFSSLMQMKMSVDDPQRASVNQILAAADRAAELTRSLLAFSRKQIMNPQLVDINQIVQKTSQFLQRIIGEDIELKTIFHGEPLPVNVDSPQIEQVLMNLATNARDVMPKGGILSIETELVQIGDDFIRAHGFGSHGEYALVSVSDTGCGMNESVRKRIFEPFFTTKELGQGTGLGLSIVYGIIKQHNGYINVYSEPGEGTTFTIYLPSLRDGVDKEVEVAKSVSVEGTETILVADDDATLRMIAEEIFTTYGYTVITAEDGYDALHKFSMNRDKIALVILDVVMPKMNGKEAFDEIRALVPGCKVIFMSGYTDDIIHKRGLLDEGLVFVTKPLRPEKLLQKVRETLDGKKGSLPGEAI